MKRTVLSLLFVCLLALAQAAPPAYGQDPGRDPEDKWEVSIDFGGEFGSVFGEPRGTCIPANNAAVALNCAPNMNPATLFLGNLEPLFGFPNLPADSVGVFRTNPALRPHEDWFWGVRIGYDFTPHWQGEFMFQRSQADLSFDQNLLDRALNELQGSLAEINNVAGFDAVNFVLLDDGQARGHHEIYQWNLYYHLNSGGRVVPYFGGGLGFVRYSAGPQQAHQIIDVDGLFLPPGSVFFQASTTTPSDNAFAFNFAGGVKVYATRHIGFRAEVRNLISRYSATHTFEVRDENQAMCMFFDEPFCSSQPLMPNSGTFEQKNTFNHLSVSGGIFLRF